MEWDFLGRSPRKGLRDKSQISNKFLIFKYRLTGHCRLLASKFAGEKGGGGLASYLKSSVYHSKFAQIMNKKNKKVNMSKFLCS